jgi:Zn-dependent metalloprotease
MAAIQGKGMPTGLEASAPAHARAASFLASHAASLGLSSGADVALKEEMARDEVGVEHVRYQQLYKGVPVTGGEILIHLKGNRVISANSKLLASPELDTTPVLRADQAVSSAQALLQRLKAKDPGPPVFSSPRLEVFNRGILDDRIYPTRLSWFIEATAERYREFIWIDARAGGVLLHFSQLATALNRQIYTADNGGDLPGRRIRQEGGPATNDSDADLAYLYTGDTYQYYLSVHGRDSFDGAGGALVSTVYVCPDDEGCPWQNAAWTGKQMIYGSGFARADDVTAHELTHAVTERTANLFYYMQSGALNESYSDIFGETVDLVNQHGNDSPSVRWQLGEDMPMGTIRDMRNPGLYGQPGKVSDPLWQHDPTDDAGGVHTNSGVPSLAYTLIVDGGTFNGRTVTGIGLTAAAKVEYRALTKYLTSGANFMDNYNALLQSCQDLIGISGITSDSCLQVKAAIEAVEMNQPVQFNSSVPAFCPTGQTVLPLFEDDFEGDPKSHWTARALQGTGTWTVQDTGWAKSGTHMAWGQDFESMGDAVLEMTAGFTLPSHAKLHFNHAYAFEEEPGVAYDGGVIEYSADGGAWQDGGSLIVGGDHYDPKAPIFGSAGNPLANRYAFVGNSYGYTASQLDLSSLSGRNVRFRFRVGTDLAVGNTGWVVDDVRLYSCQGQ